MLWGTDFSVLWLCQAVSSKMRNRIKYSGKQNKPEMLGLGGGGSAHAKLCRVQKHHLGDMVDSFPLKLGCFEP